MVLKPQAKATPRVRGEIAILLKPPWVLTASDTIGCVIAAALGIKI